MFLSSPLRPTLYYIKYGENGVCNRVGGYSQKIAHFLQ